MDGMRQSYVHVELVVLRGSWGSSLVKREPRWGGPDGNPQGQQAKRITHACVYGNGRGNVKGMINARHETTRVGP